MTENNFYEGMTSRNRGIVGPDEQEKIRNACVAIAGCGAIGGYTAIQCARLGVGRIKIADFDTFEIQNIGRQACATSSTLGSKKTAVLASYLKDVHPGLTVDVFEKGVQPENADAFVEHSDFVVDAIDVSCFYHSVLLHRSSRKKGVCVSVPQAVLHGASVLFFGPKTEDIETYLGLAPNRTRAELDAFEVPISKLCPKLPSYVDKNAIKQVESGTLAPPVVPQSVFLATAMTVSEITHVILDPTREPPGPGPSIVCIDLKDGSFARY